MTDVELAKKHGDEQLVGRISAISKNFSYEETAYHLPVSFALTGIAVHDHAEPRRQPGQLHCGSPQRRTPPQAGATQGNLRTGRLGRAGHHDHDTGRGLNRRRRFSLEETGLFPRASQSHRGIWSGMHAPWRSAANGASLWLAVFDMAWRATDPDE